MTVGEILDGGFRVIKARPRDVLIIAATFVVPVQILLAYLQRDVLDRDALVDAFTDPTVTSQTGSVSGGVWLVAALAGGMVTVWTAGAIGHLVTGWYRGVDVTPVDAIRTSLRHTWPLLVSWIAIHILQLAALFMLVLPGLIVMAFWLVTAPAIVIERLGPFAGMGRASRLAGKRFGPVLGVGVLSGVVASVVGQIFGAIPLVLGFWSGGFLGWVLLIVSGVATSLLTTPFIAAATVLAYLDLRVRNEGLDLQLRIDEMRQEA